MLQHPIYTLILSVFLVVIVIKQCIINRSLLKVRLMLSFILVFVLAFLSIFYDEMIQKENTKNIMIYGVLSCEIIIGLYFIFSVKASLSKQNYEQEILSSFDETKIVILLDKKDRIKHISDLFCKELNQPKENLIGYKFIDIFNECFDIISYNGESISKKDFTVYYSDYINRAKEGDKDQVEYILYNRIKGENFAMHLVESPLIVMNKYNGKIMVGDKKSEKNLIGIEKELNTTSDELDGLRMRFSSIIELAEEGIFFIDLDDNSVWCNDSLVLALNLSGNSLSLEEFRHYIHSEDLPLYKNRIDALTSKNPDYEITYRYKTGADYSFVKEFGKRIYGVNGLNEICGILNVLRLNHYERTNISSLDSIQNKSDLLAKATQYHNEGKVYEMVLFRLDNIPDINEKNGRDTGNLLMSEYIRQISQYFVNDNQIYRMNGLEFVALITDLRKMDVLKKNLENNEKILHTSSKYGALEISLEVFMGIAFSKDAPRPADVLKCANDCLKLALKPQISQNYVYYRDLMND